MVLRETLETPGAQAALVTPDRDLAGRVAAALLRYGVVADDSAGEPLADTPPAVFLRLLVRAVAEELAPVPLLALAETSLAAAGLSPPPAARLPGPWNSRACAVRARCPVSPACAGLDIAGARSADAAFLHALEACLEPALRIEAAQSSVPRGGSCRADRGGRTPRRHGRTAGPRPSVGRRGRRGSGDAGLPQCRRRCRFCRPAARRAARSAGRGAGGRGGAQPPGAARPRAAANILGCPSGACWRHGCKPPTDGAGWAGGSVWPPATDPGPGCRVRCGRRVGLPSPEEIVGQAAHDFVACCLRRADGRAVLSAPPRRRARVPARWLTRLETLLAGQGAALPRASGRVLGPLLDQPARRRRARCGHRARARRSAAAPPASA